MTSTLAQGVGGSPGETVRPLRALAVSPALIVLLLGGLALRLTIAYVLFPSSGFATDLAAYASWALTLAEHGTAGFYANAGFADYPPAYLYLLWPIGLLVGQSADGAARAGDLVKVPPILLDVAVGYMLYRLALGWAWPGRRAQAVALAAAALYLFNPVTFYDSALWGQSDAAGAFVLLLGAAALIRGNSEGAAAMAAAAALVKPQFGVILLPIVAFVLLKRHLLRPGSGPRHPPWAPRALAAWLSREQGWPRLLTAFAAAWTTFFVVALPFGMGPFEYLERMFGTASGYAYLSVNAFNLWAFVGSGGTASLADAWRWSDDTLPLLGLIPGLAIGAALLLAGFLWGSLRAAIRDDRWTLLVALAFLAIAFFVLPTRVHERYIVPAVALLPLLAVASRGWAVALLLLSIGAFINLHAILTLPLYGTDNVTALPLGACFRSPPLIVVSAVTQTVVGLWAAWQLRPRMRSSPDGFDVQASRSGPAPSPARPVSLRPPPLPAPEPWVRGPSALDWLVARISRPTMRADRSAHLAGERGGRLDRTDALVVIGLIIVAVTVRGYQLEHPVGMYFDEVYHARTATEFLQHWEYGQPHAIYEFTHPHLAKYAMALGIRLAGGNEVIDTADLGVPVMGAALERRWSPPDVPGQHNGDRLYIGTGEALRIYDLASRELRHEIPVPATALAIDDDAHELFIADPSGAILRLDTEALDPGEFDRSGATPRAEAFSDGPGASVGRLLVTDTSLVAIAQGSISTFDTKTGVPLSERFAFDAADAVELPWVERVVADTRLMPGRGTVARALAGELWGSAGRPSGRSASGGRSALRAFLAEEERLRQLFAIDGSVVVAAYLDEDTLARLRTAIDEGSLPGVSVESAPLLAVADHSGVSILDAWTLDAIAEIPTDDPATALALVEDGLDEPTLYMSTGASLEAVPLLDEGPGLPHRLAMPGQIRDLAWNEPAGLLHALGEAPEGGPTVYVVEPHGNAVFADAPLSLEPAYLLADTQPERPADDRGELLAVAPDGRLDRIDIDRNAFGWRLPGMLMGALMAVLLYLLARVLFARRSVGLLAGALAITEGMFFANSRIGMNDVYVTTFIVAAALLFAPLYLASRRPWTSVALIVGAGLALGLALASKWVALYAIGALLLLVLLRSVLGRAIALMSMITLTAVFGSIAIEASSPGDASRNWIFVLVMLLLSGLLAAGIVRRPLPLRRGELWLAIVGPSLVGLILVTVDVLRPPAEGTSMGDLGGALPDGRLMVGGVLVILAGLGTALVASVLGRLGRASPGPASVADAGSSGFLHPGRRGGLPWLFMLASLSLLPVGVYVLSYAPWVALGNDWGLPLLGSLPFMPEGTDGGRTLTDLTRSMYEYHDLLRAEHAASSPWWAWPLDLKPVWFFSERYADASTGLIYGSGNLVIFWLGIAAMAFAAWAAWRRRSLSLAVVVILWASLWLPWARIDRATFQYHVYASLPFMVLALAYFLAELWHGAAGRTWFLARAAAALAILAAPSLWLLRTPLCILAGTATANPDGVACSHEVTRTALVSEAFSAALVVVAAGAAAAAVLGWHAARRPTAGRRALEASTVTLAWLVVVALLTLAGVAVSFLLLDTSSPVPLTVSSDALALLALAVLAVPAWLVLRARDPRRFVLGVLAAALVWLLLWYPNLSGLPLPSEFASAYQYVLPTWDWSFQFAVNTDPAAGQGFGAGALVIAAVSVLLVVGVAVAAWLWGRGSLEHDVTTAPPTILPGPRSNASRVR